jgi:hypothetical protein
VLENHEFLVVFVSSSQCCFNQISNNKTNYNKSRKNHHRRLEKTRERKLEEVYLGLLLSPPSSENSNASGNDPAELN